MSNKFNGFSPDIFQFFSDLYENNNKAWFDSHRQLYESVIKQTAIEFVESLGERLRTIRPNMIADPRINKSIFRLNRDTRFSKDKSPYKTHLGMFFWEGNRPKLENPGLYVQIDADGLFVGNGIHQFPGDILKVYRQTVDDPQKGAQLQEITQNLERKGYSIGGAHYKNTPRGFEKNHPFSNLLKHNGLYVYMQHANKQKVMMPEFVREVSDFFEQTIALHRWIMELY